ncbi:MAG: prepilin-type N-terminal cleavage/methylation domain-containing protein [Myxococcota bacterium]|jgi:prepilin-type N-terminal cleavage/methylation domain-containing protein|nr:prepilin-type N-terminal cleavage/methylation domain-containing protein [Myxococcota bacterium]
MDSVMTRTRRSKRSRGNPRNRGFSLLEVMIALAILAFGILAMTMMQLEALRQGGAGRHTADAAAVGRTYLEQTQRLPYATLDGLKDTGWLVPAWAGARSSFDTALTNPSGGTAIEHSYNVQWRVTTVPATTCMLDVEMQVTWQEAKYNGNRNLVLATRRYNWGGASC